MEKTVNGVVYTTIHVPEEGPCTGCVGEDVFNGLCFRLVTSANCIETNVIWVKKPKVTYRERLASVVSKLTPQAALLLQYITTHGSVTQREALMDLKIQSLTKRVSELRNYFDIATEFRHHKTTGQRYARYHYRGWRSDG